MWMQCHPLLSSIIWIPLMFSRCCSGRREINHIRRKNTFTSKTVSTREGLTCRLYSLARLALQPLHFLAGFWCFTLLSRLWKHFKTPPDKPPRSGRVGGANRWGRKRMARKKKESNNTPAWLLIVSRSLRFQPDVQTCRPRFFSS